MLGDALVDAFVTAADKDDARELREAARHVLAEQGAGSGQQDDGGAGRDVGIGGGGIEVGRFKGGFDGFEEGFRLHDHAFATAEGAIVHSAVAVVGKLAQIVDMRFDEARFAGAPDDAEIERAGEKFGEDGDEVEAHRANRIARRLVEVEEAFGWDDFDAAGGHVDVDAYLLSKRNEEFAFQGIDYENWRTWNVFADGLDGGDGTDLCGWCGCLAIDNVAANEVGDEVAAGRKLDTVGQR